MVLDHSLYLGVLKLKVRQEVVLGHHKQTQLGLELLLLVVALVQAVLVVLRLGLVLVLRQGLVIQQILVAAVLELKVYPFFVFILIVMCYTNLVKLYMYMYIVMLSDCQCINFWFGIKQCAALRNG